MNTIPPEVKLNIISHVDLPTLGALATVNQQMHDLSLDESIWRQRVLDKFGEVVNIGTWAKTYEWYSTAVYLVTHTKYYHGNNFDVGSVICLNAQDARDAAFNFYISDSWTIQENRSGSLETTDELLERITVDKSMSENDEDVDLSELNDSQLTQLVDLMKTHRLPKYSDTAPTLKQTLVSINKFREHEVGRLYLDIVKSEFPISWKYGDFDYEDPDDHICSVGIKIHHFNSIEPLPYKP